METDSSLPSLQKPTACPYPEPDQSAPGPQPPNFLHILINKDGVRISTEDV